ncbi:MAG: nucleotide exchange factor GrpE [Methanotrichaceae archaeon]
MEADQEKRTENAFESKKPGLDEAKPESEPNESEIAELKQQLEEAHKLADERLDQILRCRAELDNTLKRVSKEKTELSKYASETLIVKLLPVLDSFDQAVKHDQDLDKIRQQFLDALKVEGLAPIDAVGKKFDSCYHECLMMVESDEYDEGTVVEEVLRGYTLNSKVIRFSKVLVSKK